MNSQPEFQSTTALTPSPKSAAARRHDLHGRAEIPPALNCEHERRSDPSVERLNRTFGLGR